MASLLRPHWLIIAALAAFVIGIGGLLAGYSRFSPVAIFVAELLTILAAILITTPSSASSPATSSETDTILSADEPL